MMPRILVVDDDPDMREILRRNLEAEGYAVVTAASVAQARGSLSACDCIVTDLRLPDAQALGWLPKGTPAVLVTGSPDHPPGVTVVPKPFTEEELLSAVRRAIATR